MRVAHGEGDKRRWRDAVDASHAVPFVLRSEAGAAFVDVGEAAEVAIVSDRSSRKGVLPWADSREVQILERFCTDEALSRVMPSATEYTEGALVVGERAVVVGVVRTEHDPRSSAASGFRGGAARRVICAKAGEVLRISDDPDARAP